MKPMFAKRHYVITATILRNAARTCEGDAAQAALVLVKTQFIETYQRDNPNFDLERFMEACNP